MKNNSNSKKKRILITVSILLTVFILSSILLFRLIPKILFPEYDPPKMTGSHEVLIEEYTWTDENRIETYTDTGENRSVTIKIWYPTEEGTYPLVIFSHGSLGMIDSNYSTCMELASNGYVAVSVAHPYQAIYVKDTNGNTTYIDKGFLQEVTNDNGGDTPEHEETVYHLQQKWMAVREGDVSFVLDTLLEKAAAGEPGAFTRIDPKKIGLFGHSLGGATAVALGRERTDIDAVIDLEGTMLGEYTGYENEAYSFNEKPYPVPILDVNSRAVYEEAASITGNDSQTSDASGGYVNFYVIEHAADGHSAIFEDAGHLNFTDLPIISPTLAGMLGVGSVDARTCIENVNEMVLHFFDYYLKDASTLDIKEIYNAE